MTLSSVLFLFLTHLGLGVGFSLLFVGGGAGVKFFRFNAGLAVILLVVGLAFLPPEAGAWGPFGRFSIGSLTVATAGLAVYWATIGRMLARLRPWLLGIAAASGLVALVTQALQLAGATIVWKILTVASFLTSAGLLGGACTAMILGHWYLVIPSLDVTHLQSIVKLHIASMVVRVVVVGAAVLFAMATWEPGLGPSFQRYILSVGGIFFWQRVLFGLFGPGLLSYLTWETAKIRSTQSATGILYVDFFTVVVGEVLAKYLLLATSVPV